MVVSTRSTLTTSTPKSTVRSSTRMPTQRGTKAPCQKSMPRKWSASSKSICLKREWRTILALVALTKPPTQGTPCTHKTVPSPWIASSRTSLTLISTWESRRWAAPSSARTRSTNSTTPTCKRSTCRRLQLWPRRSPDSCTRPIAATRATGVHKTSRTLKTTTRSSTTSSPMLWTSVRAALRCSHLLLKATSKRISSNGTT